MTDQTAPDIEPTDLPTALIALRQAKGENARLCQLMESLDTLQGLAEYMESKSEEDFLLPREAAIYLRDYLTAALAGQPGSAAPDWETATPVFDLYKQWVKAGPPPLGTSIARWWDARLVELRDAIHLSPDSKEQ